MDRSSITVRGLAAVAAVCALFCVAAASASAAPTVWAVTPSFPGVVTTVDGATHDVIDPAIEVGSIPESIAITPDGRRALVVNLAGDSVSVIEAASGTSVNVPLEGEVTDLPHRIAISPDGQTAYVAQLGSDEIKVLDPETEKLVGSFPTPSSVEEIAFSPDGAFAYLGNGEGIRVIDTATEEVVGPPIDVEGTPRSIAFAPDGATAYVAVSGLKAIKVIDTASDTVKTIPTDDAPTSLAVSPDGTRLYVADAQGSNSISTIATATDAFVGKTISVPNVGEIALSPDGKTAWTGGDDLTPINLVTEEAEPAVTVAGGDVAGVAVTPDQSPQAVFAAPQDVATGSAATFDGAASTDPDGSIASYDWAFGDGGTATGVTATHAYETPGTYDAKLSVVDDEGCGEELVFTGRTAYCSGSSPAVQPVTAKAAPVSVGPGSSVAPTSTVEPSDKFTFGRLVHDRRNGTVRIQVRLPGAGEVLLAGQKIRAVMRRSKGVQSIWLTVRARGALNKARKKTLRAPVKIRVTFTPDGGMPKTIDRTVALLRAPRHNH